MPPPAAAVKKVRFATTVESDTAFAESDAAVAGIGSPLLMADPSGSKSSNDNSEPEVGKFRVFCGNWGMRATLANEAVKPFPDNDSGAALNTLMAGSTARELLDQRALGSSDGSSERSTGATRASGSSEDDPDDPLWIKGIDTAVAEMAHPKGCRIHGDLLASLDLASWREQSRRWPAVAARIQVQWPASWDTRLATLQSCDTRPDDGTSHRAAVSTAVAGHDPDIVCDAAGHSCRAHPSKVKVFRWQKAERVADIGELDTCVKAQPLTSEGGTVFIISGMHWDSLKQGVHCICSFQRLGYNVVICKGLTGGQNPPSGSGLRTAISWGAIALPKIVSLLERQAVNMSDSFILCEDSCLPTTQCSPSRLSRRICPAVAVWCGAVREHKQRRVPDALAANEDGELEIHRAAAVAMAPAGSKMLVCGLRFMRNWLRLYTMSPTAWPVDYHNQVLVASGHLRVLSPFLAGQYYPHFSHRTQEWQDGKNDNKKVSLAGEPSAEPVIVTAVADYTAEDTGYLTVPAGTDLQLMHGAAEPGFNKNKYSFYFFGRRLDASFGYTGDQGWFPSDILGNVQTQFEFHKVNVM